MKMDEKQICRLCLDVADNELDEIDEITSEMLEVLLLEMDRNIIENPMICGTCMAIIKRSFYFKSACIHTEKRVACLAVNKEAELEWKDLVCSQRGTEMVIEENFRCRFCMICVKENSSVFLHILMEETFYKEMLSVFMPEMDFSCIKNPEVCSRCKEHLECYFMFIRTFMETENKLYACWRRMNNNGSRRIKSTDVLHFLHNGNMTQLNKIKWNLTSNELHGVYSCKLMKIEEILDIKDDQVSLNAESDIEIDMAMNKSHQRNTVNKVIDKSMLCTNITTYKKVLKDKDGSEIGMYQCLHCPYRSAVKGHLKRHSLVHKDASEIKMYKCELCTYATKYKSTFYRHALTHKDVSEIETYNCSLCPYKAKWKHNLKNHMITHQDVSEVNMYKCSHCPYEAKTKNSLHRHVLVHKDISEVKMYKCELCSYATKYQITSQRHALTHKEISEVRMYKCELCTYATKYKGVLQRHSLHRHMLVHEDISEVKKYKCELCSYATEYQSTSQRHALTHKDISEVRMYKCELCTYATKYKGMLQRHALTHKDVSGIKMYKCSLCSYKTKRKMQLKKHSLGHKDASELEMYKCSVCSFQTKRKQYVKKHMLTHKGVSE